MIYIYTHNCNCIIQVFKAVSIKQVLVFHICVRGSAHCRAMPHRSLILSMTLVLIYGNKAMALEFTCMCLLYIYDLLGLPRGSSTNTVA